MTDKQIIIDGCEFQSDCIEYKDISYLKIMPICAIHELSIACRDKVNKCKYYTLYKQLKRKEQEYEELRQYHNKCCIEFENEKQELLEKYNQVSRDFYNGKYCNKENCSLLKAKEQECEVLQMSDNEAKEIIAELKAECEELRRSILKIFACLIKANKDKIIDTLWVDNVTTLWDYIAQTLGIEGDQNQIEEKVKMFKEVSDDE